MTKPSMSHHFAVLKEADLVTSRRDGQQIYYSLNTTVLEDVMTRIWDLFESDNAKGTPSSEYFWLPT
jgi:ArsR family transcriptional regulator, arsenate/arsenite/antimonite-responsive transcriptional repressor